MTESLGLGGTAAPPGAAPFDDPRDRRIVQHADGLLRTFNRAGVLEAADVHVAERLGRLGGESDAEVLLAAALVVRAVRAGSVCVDLAEVAGTGGGAGDGRSDGLPWPDPDRLLQRVRASPLTGKVLHEHEELLYLDRYWREETQVIAELQSRGPEVGELGGAAPGEAAPGGAAPDEAALDEAALGEALAAYFPDPGSADQRAAADMACRSRTSVVTGGPGTGKTTTVARLLGVLLSLPTGPSGRPPRVALAAPTGKAAARMTQAVREATQVPGFPGEQDTAGPAYDRLVAIRALEATTLHRLLGARPDSRTRFRQHRGNRLPHDVVVVDETSMMSLTMTARLLEAVRPTARLVLVGDADQLASVEAGAVLHDLVDGLSGSLVEQNNRGPVTRLRHSHRFGAEIGRLAEAVRSGDEDAALEALAAGDAAGDAGSGAGSGAACGAACGAVWAVEWQPPDTDGALERLADQLTDHAVRLQQAAETRDSASALAAMDGHRLLCAHREGPYGAARWNQLVERRLAEVSGVDRLPPWYVGRPFLVNVNDYGLRLFNGDTGVVCSAPGADGSGLLAAVDDAVTPGGRLLAVSRLADVSSAYAMTVHRSQGSQYQAVTVLLPEPDSRILSRELLYTAVTRARDRLTVVGTEAAVRAAVRRPARRATGLARRLAGSLPSVV